jgi:hypothetical protein
VSYRVLGAAPIARADISVTDLSSTDRLEIPAEPFTSRIGAGTFTALLPQ